jgi:O-antigen/teichoic acid export membrane protein
VIRRAIPRLAADTFWYSAAGTIGKALALLSVPFLTRALGPGDYGVVDLATAMAGVLAVVAMFSGDIPAARLAAFADSVEARHRKYSEYVVAVAALSVGIAAVVGLSAEWVAEVVWAAPGGAGLVLLTATLIPITSVRAAIATLHRLEGNARRFALLSSMDVIGQLVFAVGLVWYGLGAYGAVLGFLIGGSLALVVTIASSYRLLSPRLRMGAIPDLVAKGAPLLPPLVAFIGADYVARALVADELGREAVGEFGLAIRIASVLALLTAAFQLAWSPRAAAMTMSVETARTFRRTLFAYVVCSGLVCIGLVSAAPEVIRLVAGDAFSGATAVLPGLAIAAVLAGTHFVLSIGSVVNGATWMVAASSIAGAIVQILVTAAAVGPLGLWGVGLGAVAGRAASVTLLAPRVAPAFGGHMVGTWIVLGGVAGASLLIGLVTAQSDGSLPIRAVATVSAAAALTVFILRLQRMEDKVPA